MKNQSDANFFAFFERIHDGFKVFFILTRPWIVVMQDELAEEDDDFFDLRGNVPFNWTLDSSAFE